MKLFFIFIFLFFLIFILFIVGIIFAVRLFSKKKVKTSCSTTQNQSKNPPPFPSNKPGQLSQQGIMRIRFDSSQMGLQTVAREQNMLESCEKAADEWINNNPTVKIISITSVLGGMNASVTVWYKNPSLNEIEK
jgi:hypothetical protein